jgi:hypothetical protein
VVKTRIALSLLRHQLYSDRQNNRAVCRNRAGSNVFGVSGATGAGHSTETTMQYLLMIYSEEAAIQSYSETKISELIAAYGAYTEAMNKAGVLVGSNRLRPSTLATTVRVADGKTQVLNGPYAETREQLGGYFLIDVPDLDAALSWAARCPGASYGAMEVRPIWVM